MEKKIFNAPVIKTLSFNGRDIITSSGEGPIEEPVDTKASLNITREGGSLTIGKGGIGIAY